MNSDAQSQMTLDCNADFVVYSLLSGFGSVTGRERDATQFILRFLPSYVNDRRAPKVSITNDAYTLAQLYLPELRVMASRHSYVHNGPLKGFKQAQVLLKVIMSPLIFHLSSEEQKQLLGSVDEAEALLSNPLDVLNELVAAWKIHHLELFTNWRSLPIAGVDEYYFGVKLPVPLALEEVLTPLPYPSKTSRTVWTCHEKTPNRHVKLPPRGRTLPQEPIDFQLIPSRSSKKSELKSLNPRLQYFAFPDLVRTSSDSSSVSTDSCGFISLSSNSPLIEGEVFEESTWDLVEDRSELECACCEGQTCDINTGYCRASSRAYAYPKHGERIVNQWRRLLRRR
ncbi:unnamed protein product [Rhizoctonia solani]|uniref:Uncharacterized protein n=1 Tax=Rhizoctonia solani TaxID=456999 RepID=A0A8H3DU49_9AGAM|nr:unnamed protein product [Rhizoctonia solani]